MEYRRLGRTGLRVSSVGLGTWLTFGGRVDDRAASALVRRAVELGVNLFDTADVYENGRAEEALGRALEASRARTSSSRRSAFSRWGPGPTIAG